MKVLLNTAITFFYSCNSINVIVYYNMYNLIVLNLGKHNFNDHCLFYPLYGKRGKVREIRNFFLLQV